MSLPNFYNIESLLVLAKIWKGNIFFFILIVKTEHLRNGSSNIYAEYDICVY